VSVSSYLFTTLSDIVTIFLEPSLGVDGHLGLVVPSLSFELRSLILELVSLPDGLPLSLGSLGNFLPVPGLFFEPDGGFLIECGDFKSSENKHIRL
jgi:hypothetical protein